MRIYYCAEAGGLSDHVRTALGVDVRAWNEMSRRVRDWGKELESRYHVPTGSELRPCELLNAAGQSALPFNCGNDHSLTQKQGLEVIRAGLRLIEEFAINTGVVGATSAPPRAWKSVSGTGSIAASANGTANWKCNTAFPPTLSCAPLTCWPPQRRPAVAVATRNRRPGTQWRWCPRGCASSRTLPWRPVASRWQRSAWTWTKRRHTAG